MVHRNVDDATPALFKHLGRHFASHQKRPIHIGVDDHSPHGGVGLPELRGRIEEFLADETHPPSGVVYEDVNRAELANGLAHYIPAVFFTGDISHKLADRPSLPDFHAFICHHFAFLASPRSRNHYVRSCAYQSQRQRPAQSATGTGDYRRLTPKFSSCHFPSLPIPPCAKFQEGVRHETGPQFTLNSYVCND